METKHIVIVSVLAVLVVGVLVVMSVLYFYPLQSEIVIGGDKDENGCLIAAGYSWNASEGACVREWETGYVRYQVMDFEDCERAGYPVMESYPRKCEADNGVFIEKVDDFGEGGELMDLDDYFRDQMWRRGVENNGGMMPIEGFDPNMYLGAFPGLAKSDFDGVSAIGGRWELQGGELKFIGDSEMMMTSADGTVNEEGMEMLLDNLEERLGIEVESHDDVDELIDVLSN